MGCKRIRKSRSSHFRYGHPDGRKTIVPVHKGKTIGRGLLTLAAPLGPVPATAATANITLTCTTTIGGFAAQSSAGRGAGGGQIDIVVTGEMNVATPQF